MLSDARLAEIRARCQEITPSPWEEWEEIGRDLQLTGSWTISQSRRHEDIAIVTANCDIPPEIARGNAHFIAHARQDISDLLDEVARLRTELAECRRPR